MSKIFNLMIELEWTVGDLYNYVQWCSANGFDVCNVDALDEYVYVCYANRLMFLE